MLKEKATWLDSHSICITVSKKSNNGLITGLHYQKTAEKGDTKDNDGKGRQSAKYEAKNLVCES